MTIKKNYILIIILLILIYLAYHFFYHPTVKRHFITVTPPVNFIVFGDSLSDMGNREDAPYTSNGGKVWAVYLAQAFGGTMTPSNQGGNDWAIGGDETGTSQYQSNDDGGVVGQVTQYLQLVNNQADPNSVYIVWAGGNDFLHYFEKAASFEPPDSVYNNAVNNLQQVLDKLHQAGATQLVILNLPLLGDAPFGNKPFLQGKVNAVSDKFNQDLQTRINSLNYPIELIDVAGDMQQVYDHPEQYGFVNVTDMCEDNSACNPETWMFWDQIHPTDGGHQAIAKDLGQYFKAAS